MPGARATMAVASSSALQPKRAMIATLAEENQCPMIEINIAFAMG